MDNNQSPIEITNYPIESSSSNNPPSNSEGFLFLELPDLNSLLYLGGSTPENFGLYLFDINNSTWEKSTLKGDTLPPMNYFSGWYDMPFLFIHGGKSLQKGENKSFKETYLIDISTKTIHKLFTIEEPSSRYGHMAIKNNDKQAYIFGGCNIGKKNERYLNDLHKMEYKNISVITGDNANVNGASWIVNIQTKGDKPPGRKGYSMMYAESINSLIIYGGELKDNKINDNGIYIYNVDDKEYKKINIKGSDILGCRAYHSMQLNDTSNKIYIIGGIDNNKNVLNDIIEVEVIDKENISVKKYEGNDLLGKRYNHKGCNIFFRGENETNLLYHILILGGKKSENEFYDNSLIDIFIKDNENPENNKINGEENNLENIKEEEIEENMGKLLNKKEKNLYDNDGDIEKNENENNLPMKLINDYNSEKNNLIPYSNSTSNSNRTIYSNHNNKLDNKSNKSNSNSNINEYHINLNKKAKLDNLIKLQKEYIEKYKKYQKINEEYYINRNKLNELNVKELTKKIMEKNYKNKKNEKNMKLDKIKGEIFTLKKKVKENKNYNELLNQYMNLYKQRFCYLSDFLGNYIEDITKLDNILMEYGTSTQGLNYEVFWNKRKRYQMQVINLFREIKKFNFFEKNLWEEIKNKRNSIDGYNDNSFRNTVKRANKKEDTLNMNEI
jgi:hypothetical protein